MSLSIERLHELLIEDEECKNRRNQEHKARQISLLPLQDAIHEVYQSHGIAPPVTGGAWIRPIPPNLFRCPPSMPQATLVPWSSLPRAVKSRLKAPPEIDNKNGDAIVEVPLHYLVAEDGNATNGASLLKRRPLGGNLTDKLTEYTRGASGQCRPFRAGGVGENEIDNGEDEEYRTLEDIQRAQSVLEKGSMAAWNDGTILTAPPGVDFNVGLSWKGIHGEESDQVINADRPGDAQFTFNEPQSHSLEFSKTDDFLPVTSESVWERAYFDDDSLFGSSEGSEDSDESDDESDDHDITDSDERSVEEDEIGHDHETKNAGEEARVAATPVQDGDEVAMGDEEIDGLLEDLTVSDSNPREKRHPIIANNANPLQLAERQAQYQNNNTRKSWADTSLLPIDDFSSLVPNPAISYPFTLDGFQQQAIARLERSESVFVAAHTSAGKTVVAEYACALAKQRATRCVYTSPIKALSNQKFRDFCRKFGPENVGLITGDLQLNVDDSTCLIMTTEILRSMLYRGADLIRDIEWVIFDEVHYVNDSERGVVWEEVIIMLPQYVNLVFLSATTPNTIDFSDWIGRTKRKPVYVVKTNYRPVPLSHHLWAGLKLHKIMEGNGRFSEKAYKEATEALLPASAKDNSGKKGAGGRGSGPSARTGTGSKHLAWQAQGNKQNWMSLVRFLDREVLTPAVVFSFSKKKCEEIANMLRSLDLNTAAERSAVQAFALQTVARLSPNDAVLPQVLTICEMVKRGIGVHHGGLLPILKEMVEILFSRNLIKVLFATETFAMGVNMPTRAVVFNSIRKHDGIQFRGLEPGEYTQMAGRAGRRGLDKVGTVIICCFGEVPPPLPILKHMLTGSSTLLRSQFRLTYNMILNLLRVEEMSVEGMIKRSFSEFATQRALTANQYPQLLAKGIRTLEKLDEQFKAEAVLRVGAEDLEDYFAASSELVEANAQIMARVMESSDIRGDGPFSVGRIILVTAARKYGLVRAPAIILRVAGGKNEASKSLGAVVMALLPETYVSSQESRSDSAVKKEDLNAKPGTVGFIGFSRKRHYRILEAKLDEILCATSIKQKVDVTAILKDERTHDVDKTFSGSASSAARNPFAGMKAIRKKDDTQLENSGEKNRKTKDDQAVDRIVGWLIDAEQREFDGGLSVLDCREYVKSGSDVVEFRRDCDYMKDLAFRVRSFSSHRHRSIEKHYVALERKETLRKRLTTLRHLLSNESLQLFPDFLQRKKVLRTLGYIDENDTVCVKGRVACEVNTCEELIVTELVFEGLLNELEPAEIVAALSSLVYQEKSDDNSFDVELPETLIGCCQGMKTIATNLGHLQKEHGLDIDPGEYTEASLKFGLVHVVYEWALGVPFSSICELTMVQEGSIVRCITRLDELCREVRNCARVVGNPTLYRKMEAASTAIKRDIVFASSLYVS